MNKTYLTFGAVVLLALGLCVGCVLPHSSSPALGGYNPPVVSAGGFAASYATSTAYTLACSPQNVQWLGTSALATGTINAATTTFAACPNLDVAGTSVVGSKIVNDSTNTASYAGGVGDVFKCETTAVGTSTVGAGGTCSATGFTLLASSTVDISYLFDSNSSSLVIDVGNNYK
jgi:hypothetical protein